MELNQLIYFQKVARLGSVTQAAKELFIAQPTLSQSLCRLEESIGVPLFQRQPGKKLSLNPAGEAFLRRTEQILSDLDAAILEAQGASQTANDHVSLASSVHDLCQDLVLGFFQTYPGVSISQRMVDSHTLTELLLNDEVDFALSAHPLPDPRLECKPLYVEEFMLVVGPNHSLYGTKTVTPSQMIHEHFICNYAESDRNFLDALFSDYDQRVEIICETNEPNMIHQLVQNGIGVAFRPAYQVKLRREQNPMPETNWAVRIVDHHFSTPTCISRKKQRNLTPAAQAFFSFAEAHCQEARGKVTDFLNQRYPIS